MVRVLRFHRKLADRARRAARLDDGPAFGVRHHGLLAGIQGRFIHRSILDTGRDPFHDRAKGLYWPARPRIG